MGTPNGGPKISSPPIFQSNNPFSIDESKLCFNKTHFNRPDFNVERFMNLARQKADLKTIQQDLRLYLKCVQNSMIELINDDYADFVHLSSNLVGLQESLNKIDEDIERIWKEFSETTKDSIGVSERIEQKCEDLTLNREKQAELRDRIAFLSSIQKLGSMLRNPPSQCSVLWLQTVASFVVEMTSMKVIQSAEEKNGHEAVLSLLESILCKEGVKSASSDCVTLPLILSILSITDSSYSLTALLVSDLLYPTFVVPNEDQYLRLVGVFKNVMKQREDWAEKLGNGFRGKIRDFLDETLLTFVLTFIDKCMGTVAVPSDTRLFHKCFLATQDFIEKWPSKKSRHLLKSIREKFNLLVYFKLETHKFTRDIDKQIIPDNFSLCEQSTSGASEFNCKSSVTIYESIEHIWSDDVYISFIIDKLWDFTLRQIIKHLAWVNEMKRYIIEEKKSIEGFEIWKTILMIRIDAEHFYSNVFDFALENIWTMLRELDVDTSQFGQCLTKHRVSVKSTCDELDKHIISVFGEVINNELVQVSDVPKQYRWTKKPAPTSHSTYIQNSVEMIEGFRKELENNDLDNSDEITKQVCSFAFSCFAIRAKEVQDTVEATGSSLSRFKRKNTTDGTVTDDDKIKIQIYHDALYLFEESKKLEINVQGLQDVVERFKGVVTQKSDGVSAE